MKIHITGNAGSGKSTISREISETLGLPLHGLDEIVWKENWVQASAHERSTQVLNITRDSNWVIDGVSKEARKAADIIVFLDRNPLLCATRAIKRNLPYLFRSRPGLPAGCYEIKILPFLMLLIFRFNSTVKPNILKDISRRSHIILRTDREVRKYLDDLAYKNADLKLAPKTNPNCQGYQL